MDLAGAIARQAYGLIPRLRLFFESGDIKTNLVIFDPAAYDLPRPQVAQQLLFRDVGKSLSAPGNAGHHVPAVDKAIAVGHPLPKGIHQR